MHPLLSSIAVLCVACHIEPVAFTPIEAVPPTEDCASNGDEDDNGAADCADPACTGEPRCQPTCSDGAPNGTETDVDCGGTCPACEAGRICERDSDCASLGVCDAQRCRVARSCAELHERYPAAADGAYAIQPVASTAPFQVACDMVRDGGGWTLLLKSIGDAVFANSAAAWSDDSLLAADDVTTQPGNAKYASFTTLPVTTLRGELDGFRFIQTFAGDSTARAIFAGPTATVDTFPTFNTGAPNWSAQPNCHTFGINIPYSTRARFGWSANQEADCLTNDTAIGLGINSRGAGYVCGSTECSAGNVDASGVGLLWAR